MKRRSVLKKLGALGAASTIPFALSANLEDLKNTKKLGVALVGLGNYATRQLAPALQHTQHIELRGIVTGTPAKEEKWQKEYGISKANTYNYKNFDSIKNNDEIDIIYIVLPNFMHAEYTIRALEAGKHVICEKPMGMNAKECEMMLEAQKKAGKLLQIGYRLFYEPSHLFAKQIGNEQQWGKVKMIESSLGFRMGRPDIWRVDPKMGGGGAIMDLGVYCIQAARRMVGMKPSRVLASGFVDEPDLYKGIYESMMFQMEFPNGSISNTTTTFSSYVDRFHTAFTGGWIELKPSFNGGQKVQINASKEHNFIAPDRPFQQIAQMDAFALNIRENTPVIASGEEGLIDMEIIDAIKLSARERMAVSL
jgi:predicted dehydrogenase